MSGSELQRCDLLRCPFYKLPLIRKPNLRMRVIEIVYNYKKSYNSTSKRGSIKNVNVYLYIHVYLHETFSSIIKL